ncbi:BglII/BstYI family type II restriction endonuclease [Branchiibius cervicis]|uniref:BglII/BstYI family type II restriction endonuclease n=1 Tax=Branchiibius cervicis TaxID=908252 RepID=A0ABW2AW16_9MICO
MTSDASDHETVEDTELDGEPTGAIDVAGAVRYVHDRSWPIGYVYGATRYADVILRQSFPGRYIDLLAALNGFRPTLTELRTGGGGRTVFVARFDQSLADMRNPDGSLVWGKQNVTIEKSVGLDGTPLRTVRTRGHEIDMFGKGTASEPLPGIAVEMEWNNKDPFFDRDLINFQALHHEGAIAIGVIVTRGPKLQRLIGPTIRSKEEGQKYGQSSTHWDKLIPKVNLGGGGECPLLLIGIEPERIDGISLVYDAKAKLDAAAAFKRDWRESFAKWADAKPHHDDLLRQAAELLPPLR